MAAAKLDLIVEEGTNWTTKFTWHDSAGAAVNITGYSAELKARPTKTSATTLVSLTSGAGTIALGGAAGTVTLAVIAATTGAYSFTRAFYDLELTSGSNVVTRLAEGNLTLTREVTR